MNIALLLLFVSSFFENSLQQMLNSTQYTALMAAFDELGVCTTTE